MNIIVYQKIVFVILLLISVLPKDTYASSIRIEFDGVFSGCDFLCSGELSERLFNQKFSGTLEIPNHEKVEIFDEFSVAIPYEADRGLYKLNSPSFMSLTTGDSQFDIKKESPVSVTVQHCKESSCPKLEDFVNFIVETDSYTFTLNLFAPSIPFVNTNLPSLESYRQFNGSTMGVMKSDYSDGVFSGIMLSNVIVSEVETSAEDPDTEDDFLILQLPSILSTLKNKT